MMRVVHKCSKILIHLRMFMHADAKQRGGERGIRVNSICHKVSLSWWNKNILAYI